jgi:antitoxin VapB
VDAYAASGFPGEWEFHHQGGASGYEPREYLATPGSKDIVMAGQGYAWNPSIAGVKSEDTILVGLDANEIVTHISDWPATKLTASGRTMLRPRILEIT